MRRLAPSLSLGVVSLLAIVAIRCGGDSPTGPSKPIVRDPGHAVPEALASTLELEAQDEVVALDRTPFERAVAMLGGRPADLSEKAAEAWILQLIRAPKTGTKFKVSKEGMFPSPAPKFRFRVSAPVNIPEGALLAFFLTSGGKECAIAIPRDFVSFPANVAKNVDIPNDYIIAGPQACFLDGQNCTASQCKFPLTTTKIKVYAGNSDQSVTQTTITLKYVWNTASSGGGGGGTPNPNPTPNPGSTPDPGNGGGGGGSNSCSNPPSSAACGTPTARCNDGTYSCSQNNSGTCSSHGGVSCFVCPGPLCN